MKVLIAVLTYNCSSKIQDPAEEIIKLDSMNFAELGLEKEVRIFDDGSSDGAAEKLKSCFLDNKLTLHKKNKGYGANVKSALDAAISQNFKFLLIFPGDMQRRSEDIYKLCESMVGNNFDVVVGEPDKKNIKGKVPIGRKIGRYLINRLSFLFWNDCFGDSLSGFKIYDVEKCREIVWLCQDRFGYDLDFSFWSQVYGLKIGSIKASVSYENHLTTINSTMLQGFTFVLRVLILGLVQQPLIKLLRSSFLYKKL